MGVSCLKRCSCLRQAERNHPWEDGDGGSIRFRKRFGSPRRLNQCSSSACHSTHMYQHFWGAVFRIRIRLDPYSESGFRIQMFKNRFKKPKFTMTDYKDKNSSLNHSFLSLFQELITLCNFILSRTVKKLSHRM
jgi:hypothetical protein